MSLDDGISRKDFLKTMLIGAASGALPAGAFAALQEPATQVGEEITLEDLKSFEKVAGISFSDEERKQILASVRSARRGFESVRRQGIDYTHEPPTVFTPRGRIPSKPAGNALQLSFTRSSRPARVEDLAFASAREHAHLIRTRQVTSMELTQMYLARLKEYGEKLLAVTALTEKLALEQAAKADDDIHRGNYRSPLHGLPYGIKDLFATAGIPTTWGAEPYKDQVFDYDATVVERLEKAGAVLCAKFSVGSLAMGDVWHRGRTKNPWNPEQGSSGSSAGSAAATAAGLVSFSIGTETLGSIMSPSHVCRVTGLRPTYGRISRFGAMGLSYTMDKVGPICRHVEDCAMVLHAIHGRDPRDPSAVEMPFRYSPRVNWSALRIGYLVGHNDSLLDRTIIERTDFLRVLSDLGARLEPVRFEPAPTGINTILSVEAASAFDEFTRTDAIHRLKNSAWPSTFRAHRFVPAVEYLQAQRARSILMDRFEKELGNLDVVVANERGGSLLFITNLTGHPQVLVPNGVDEKGNQRSVSFIGRLYDEDLLLAVARAYQEATPHHLQHPNLSKLRAMK
jgi:Asp-tRNA(Asn)/Glu-tRNA(Gln) amidotransferase A subunit family amidase